MGFKKKIVQLLREEVSHRKTRDGRTNSRFENFDKLIVLSHKEVRGMAALVNTVVEAQAYQTKYRGRLHETLNRLARRIDGQESRYARLELSMAVLLDRYAKLAGERGTVSALTKRIVTLEGQVDVLKKAAVGVVFRSQGKMVAEGQYDNPITNEDHTESSKEDGSL